MHGSPALEPVLVDFNHPLAGTEIEVDISETEASQALTTRKEHDPLLKVTQWLNAGIGVQAYTLRSLFDSPLAR